jgi:hypothetical protein
VPVPVRTASAIGATAGPSGATRWRSSPGRLAVMGSLASVAMATGACGHGAASLGSPSPQASQTAVPATSATAELRSAAHALAGATNFTFASTVTVGASSSQISGQVQAPNLVHITVKGASAGTTEVLFVGTKSFVRVKDGTWQSKLSTSSASADPRSTFAVVDTATSVTAEPTVTPGTTNFGLQLSPAAAARIVTGAGTRAGSTLTGTATVRNGVLTNLTLHSPSAESPLTVSIDYSAVGTTPAIPLPPGA